MLSAISMCEDVVKVLGLNVEFRHFGYPSSEKKLIENLFKHFFETLMQIKTETVGIIPSNINRDKILDIVALIILDFRSQILKDEKLFWKQESSVNWFWERVEAHLT